MGYFDNLDAAPAFLDARPFASLNSIKWRARAILRGRSNEKIERTAGEVLVAISAFKEEETEREFDRYVANLHRAGGWELRYWEGAESGHSPTLSDIYGLLENWPHWASERPNIPAEDDITDLEAFREILESDNFLPGSSDPIFLDHELFAVLALLRLEDVARLTWTDKKRAFIDPGLTPWTKDALILAGSILAEAMEIICWAERAIASKKLAEMRDEQKKNIAEQARLDERKLASKHAVNTKNAPNRKAETFVRGEWLKNKAEYNNNKTSFARDYVPIVANKFKNNKGEPLKITEKQMREVWLSDTPPTRKPARQRVGG
jgi:hypothetical protein